MNPFAIINPDTDTEVCTTLKGLGIEPVFVDHTNLVASPLSGHPDLQIFPYGEKIICHPDISNSFLKRIESRIEVILGTSKLGDSYPSDIPYNIAFTGKYAFHLTASTDPLIKISFGSDNIPLLNVKQGYSKCSTMIVDQESIITSDTTIHKAAVHNNIDSLLISPGAIELPGYDYGFIGGTAGNFNDYILVTGSLEHHPDFNSITEFINSHSKEVKVLSQKPAVDLGSIFIYHQ